MNEKKIQNVYELDANLILDPNSIGSFIGISDQAKRNWKLAVYFGKN